MRTQHPLGEHLATCSDPTNCGEYAAVLAMTPEQHADYINESTARFAQKRASSGQFRASQQEDYTPPDAYTVDVAKRRQAEETPESRFAARFAAERTAAFEAEYAEDAAATQPPPPRLTAAQLAEFEPPNPYDAPLAKLKESHR